MGSADSISMHNDARWIDNIKQDSIRHITTNMKFDHDMIGFMRYIHNALQDQLGYEEFYLDFLMCLVVGDNFQHLHSH